VILDWLISKVFPPVTDEFYDRVDDAIVDLLVALGWTDLA
jgi:hypothetical protein